MIHSMAIALSILLLLKGLLERGKKEKKGRREYIGR